MSARKQPYHSLHPAMTAADYLLAAIGVKNAPLAVSALSAGWLTYDEAETLRPVADCVSWLADIDPPIHRRRGKVTA